MKKLYLFLAFILTISCITACGAPTAEPTLSPTQSASATATPTATPEATPILKEVAVNSVNGLNEQIHINMPIPESGDITVYYKASDAEEYSILDRELMIYGKKEIDCYILGLAKGLYDIKIEQCNGDEAITKLVTDIDVEKQDRSGYAHFKLEEGIGGYNNDGTVKDDAIILYVTNKTKNTVTLDINGTTYTGLVAILQASHLIDRPLIVRVLDKITTNQWKNKESGYRYVDEETHDENFLTNSFTAFGENLEGLIVYLYDSKQGVVYYHTTLPDGLKNYGPMKYKVETAIDEDGREYYLDRHEILNIEVRNANNITIEGVGTTAAFYQFGINFIYCDSIEVRNLTISKYTKDGLNFTCFDHESEHGRYWIHNNTFGAGYNAWVLPGIDYPSDEALDLCNVNNVTISYNKFDSPHMGIIMASTETDHQMNTTIHHNHFYNVMQRTPLCSNANVHNYNNYYHNCRYGISPRLNTYMLSEANYSSCYYHYYTVDGQSFGSVKSYNNNFAEYLDDICDIIIVTERDAIIPNINDPSWNSDYSNFDTNPELFYYDVENKCSDVELMHDVKNITSFVQTYSGAGIYKKIELSK